MSTSVKHLRNGAIFLAVVSLFAVAGYVIAGWSLIESCYMAVITVFSVGYGEVNMIESDGLRIMTMVFIILGCTGYLYIGGALVQFLIEGQIETAMGNRRMSKSIQNLTGHTIVCGYGRVGRMLATELNEANQPFVVLDRNESHKGALEQKGFLYVFGEATDEKALKEAGIKKAAQVAVVLPDDAANVFITLSARNLNPDLFIIARGMATTTEPKLKQAGANQVVLPEHIGAERIASLILRPTASSLISDGVIGSHLVADLDEMGLNVEEFSIPEGSNIAGLTLADLETRGSSAFLIVAIVRASGDVVKQPTLETKLIVGDILISISHSDQPPEFARLFQVKSEVQYRGARLK
ncbi:MAG: potassium channel protein [Verrucomicrobiales bacterium]|nr:potassium channel protein [Verrucomicrobiales bacterium]